MIDTSRGYRQETMMLQSGMIYPRIPNHTQNSRDVSSLVGICTPASSPHVIFTPRSCAPCSLSLAGGRGLGAGGGMGGG